MEESTITLDISEHIATLTLNRPNTLNSLTRADYNFLANTLREIDANDDWTGKWFCAGTDVKGRTPEEAVESLGNLRKSLRANVVDTTLDVGQALYTHRKILVAALNGPVLAFLGYFDFIYALPHVWLATPFTFLGIVAEGGASVSFVNRMGLTMAKEVLIWGKKKKAQELLARGFINKIYPEQSVESFHTAVRNEILYDLEGLDPASILTVKSLIQAGLNEKNNMDGVNLRESYAQAARFASGVPAQQFARIARKEIKHKL
ncbi:ClpP/crotonase-like domain-containing protein [Ephemerocybe angulata]|uniref:ClpP/crotonase-like domain-containing protein n=1 Tax=Ephemerocybe angulata TaxID=980116 RepID=A0A8H6IGQ6_9AGAR|nr:ClpP/crotonase-like domain-containing protein [Tulosesus angulatus]